jgi:hypothetical protein
MDRVSNHALSVAINIAMNSFELALMISTIIAPIRLQAVWRRYIVYTLVTGVVWFIFCIVAMFWWPEPGIGVLLLGFISGS